MKLRALNPVRLFLGPIFQMEVRTAGRRPSTYVFRTLFALLVVLFFSIFLIGNWSSLDESSTVARMQQVQGIAPQLAMAILWTQYPALLLLAPIITGPALCDERRQRTLPALLTTPLNSWEIVLGKLSGRLTQALILGAISLPVMLGARLLGGLSAEGVLIAVLLTVISVIQIAAIALLLSASSPRATTAAASAFLVFLFFNFGPMLGILIYNEWIVPKTALAPLGVEWMFRTSLPISLGGASITYFIGENPGFYGMQLWGWSAIYGLALTVLVVFSAGLRLRATMRQDPEGIQIQRKLKKRKRKSRKSAAPPTPATSTDPDAPAAADAAATLEPAQAPEAIDLEDTRASRIVSDTPVLWRECRQGLFRRRRTRWLTLAGLILGFALFYTNATLDDAPNHIIIAEACLVVLLLQTVFGSTTLIPHERESRTLDVLLTTPLRPRSIIFGKLIGAVRRLWLAPACLFLHMFIAAGSGYMSPLVLPILLLTLVPPLFLLLSTGLLAGVVFRRAITASAANLAIPVCLYAALPFLFALVADQFYSWDGDSFDYAFTALMSINPFATTGVAVEGLSLYEWSGMRRGELLFNMPHGDMTPTAFILMLIAAGAVQIALGTLANLTAARLLPTREGRPN